MLQATRFLLGFGVVVALGGCTRDQPDGAATPASAPAAATTAPAPAPGDDGISGTVLETMNSGGYTYAKLDGGATQVWVAGPETALSVGAKVTKARGTLMTGFRSETLSRTFDEIYFVSSFPVAGSAAPNPHAGASATTAPVAAIAKLEPVAGGNTVAEIFAAKDRLAGKPIVLRGKVVKVNNGILGRNWIHVQDGTGGAGTNDLVVTMPTAVTATLGSVVVLRGTVAINKDFGAGYTYGVLVEDATIAPQ